LTNSGTLPRPKAIRRPLNLNRENQKSLGSGRARRDAAASNAGVANVARPLQRKDMEYREHPNRKCISGSDGSLIPARSGDHTELWLLSVAKLIAKVRTFAADFCSKESPAEPMTGKPLQNLRILQWLAELHFLFGCSPEPKTTLEGPERIRAHTATAGKGIRCLENGRGV
jgi:hypothetical protein